MQLIPKMDQSQFIDTADTLIWLITNLMNYS